ncbi:MAG: malonyl-CoA synthase [Emcibacter sp.]|nr:malonyl-CoA synthase [Emcibacter sp.]
MNANLFNVIEKNIENIDKKFIETDQGKIYSYGDMLTLSAQYANALVSLGVKADDRIAVQVDKSPEVLFLYLACLRVGAIYLPLNTDYTLSEVTYFLKDAEPILAVCQPNQISGFENIARTTGVKHIQTMDNLRDRAAQSKILFNTVPRKPHDLAAILYTSGTTGRSKGAMLTHDNLISNARVLVDYWHFTSQDCLLHALPIYHTHGLFVATNTVLLSRSSLLFMPKFSVSELERLMAQATVMMGVPTHYHRLLASAEFNRSLAKNMRLFISGSAPLSPETHKEFFDRTGQAILERYGMTETNMNTSNPYDGERRPGTVGFPLPGIELRIADPKTARILPQGEIGVIEVKGPNVFKGYWRMPEKTATEFRADGFFITGDLGSIDKQGYVSISGRDKDLIITGGLNVYPAEIEATVDALPIVTESAVIGVPHADFGEAVVAIVVIKKGEILDEAITRQTLSQTLATFKVPKRIIVMDALPRNSMGKIQKNLLRDQYGTLFN